MSDVNHGDNIDTRNPRPPYPHPAPENKKWVWVHDYTDPKTRKVVTAHWRLSPLHSEPRPKRDYKAERARRAAERVTPGPKPGKPRLTSPAHAEYLRGRLDVPATYFVTLRHSQPHDAETDQLLHECHSIVRMAQLFIGRFTTNKDMSDG